MKKDLKNMFIGLFVLLLYLLQNNLSQIIVSILKLNNLNKTNQIIYNLIFEGILIAIIIFIYHKKIKNDFDNFKKCKFSSYIRYWFIAICLMSISTIIINMITSIDTSTNQEIIIDALKKAPIYITILTVIYAPILEELVFRLSFRKIFKTDLLFIIISGLFFGFMHIINLSNPLEILFIIPYSIPGFIFAYTLVKSNNIFVPIGLHFIHNTIMLLIQFIIY